jgi:hypothetical protein
MKILTSLILQYSFLWFALSVASCQAQTSSPFAPESGAYGGVVNSSETVGEYSYDAITGYGVRPSLKMRMSPSALGDLILDTKGGDKGTYKLVAVNWTGSWQFNPVSKELSFTGPLNEANVGYLASKGYYNIWITLTEKKTNSAVTYNYYKQASKPFPKIINPNGKLNGKLTIKKDDKTYSMFDIATGKTIQTFKGTQASTNRNKFTLEASYEDVINVYDSHNRLTVYDASGHAETYSPKNWKWDIANYNSGILADDNTTIALMGKMYTQRGAGWGIYPPSKPGVIIGNLNTGKMMTFLEAHKDYFIKPAFLQDGRLVYSPKEEGIAITDKDYKNSKTIYPNKISALAVSPDNRQIAFSEDLYLYTVNLDGTNKKQVMCNGEAFKFTKADKVGDIAWSPDGKYLIISYGNYIYNVVLVPLNGSKWSLIQDEDGEAVRHYNWMISWH